MSNEMQRDATFSPCRTYRYSLWRRWGAPSDGYAMFIGLNPSTADEIADDPTVRRCIAFARDWGYGALCMTNIFAFRATDPEVMKASASPVGPMNDATLLELSRNAGVVVAAWGTHGAFLNRDTHVRELIPNLTCLKKTKYGFPGHPLYLKKSLVPIPF
jgi:hypothetical protein